MKSRADFLDNAFAVLLLIQVERLPVPLALTWRCGHGQVRPRLNVQVADLDFRRWLAQIAEPEMDREEFAGELHLHAEGRLLRAPSARVHLVTVTSLTMSEVVLP